MPVLALCQALRSQNTSAEVFFIGTGDEAERALVENEGLTYYAVVSGKFRRYGRGLVTELTDLKTLRANAQDAKNFLTSRKKAEKLLRLINPDVVFTKGSNPSVPVGLAATKLHIPLVIHESDSVMGLANRLLARKATTIATGFPIKQFARLTTRAQFVHTGSPIRTALQSGSPTKANTFFKLKAKKPVLLVLGGSQGALPINNVIWESLDMLTDDIQIIHQTGKHTQASTRRQHPDYHSYVILGDELADAYARADIVVSRCGATTLAELAHFRKPSILIPWPGAANHHQEANAAFFSHRGAARVIEQSTLTPQTLFREVTKLLEHPADCRHLSDAIGQIAQPDAAAALAALVLATGAQHA